MVPVDAHPVLRKTRLRRPEIPEWGFGIHGKIYHAESFAAIHPGGSAWVRVVRGTDASVLFEMSHIDRQKAERLLASLTPVGDFVCEGSIDFRSHRMLVRRIRSIFPTRESRSCHHIAHFYAVLAAAFALHAMLLRIYSVFTPQWTVMVGVSAIVNTLLGGWGHNFLHQMHPGALGLDWNGLSSFEWLLEHVVSHHPRPNTRDDHDAISMLPFVDWLCPKWSNCAIFPIFALGEVVVAIVGNFGHGCRWKAARFGMPGWMVAGPLLFWLRLASHIFFQGVWVGTVTMMCCLTTASLYFSLLAHLNHTSNAPDACRDVILQQIGATDDLVGLPAPFLLGLDRQVAHHLLPTIDHGKLTQPRLKSELRRHLPAAKRPLSLSSAFATMLTRVLPRHGIK